MSDDEYPDATIACSPEEVRAYKRWQIAVADYRAKEQALMAAKQEADAAVVELAKFATTAQGTP